MSLRPLSIVSVGITVLRERGMTDWTEAETMGQREDLLAAIYQAPEQDEPRLVYSDWLEDHGELPRAELIRLQIQIVKLDEGDPEREPLKQKAREIERAHAGEWEQELPNWSGVSISKEHSRGFPYYATVTAPAFLRYGEKLLERMPLQALRITRLTEDNVKKVAISPVLKQITELSLENNPLRDKNTKVFFENAQLSSLKSLDLHTTELSGHRAAMTTLARAPFMQQLEMLRISDNPIGDAGFKQLAEIGDGSLRTLYASRLGLTGDSGTFLSESPFFANLEILDIHGNWLGDAGVALMAGGGNPTLKELDLSSNEIGDWGVEQLASFPRVSRLRKLNLMANHIGSSGVVALAESPYLTCLEELELGRGSQASDIGAIAIARSRSMGNLIMLDLDGNGIGPEGVRALASSPHMKKLQHLYLSENDLGSAGARAIADSEHLRQLRSLMIVNCDIGDEGCKALMQSPVIETLTGLWMDRNGLTDEGAQAILDTPYLQHLEEDLTVDDEEVSDEMILELRERYPVFFCYRPHLDEE